MSNGFKTIEVGADSGVLTITLSRPDALNALNEQMSTEISAAIRTGERDKKIRCILLTAAGRAFCAGQDLKVVRNHLSGSEDPHAMDYGTLLRKHYNPLIARIRTLEKPVVAAINGIAAGGGASLAFACDLRICAMSASFKMAFINIGLVPDMGATHTLMRQVGYARAAEMCLLGDSLSAEEALACGLVNQLVDDAHLEATASGVAARLAKMPPKALALTKRALNRAQQSTLDQQLDYEAFLQDTAGQTADHREGVAAFFDKRTPEFKGK